MGKIKDLPPYERPREKAMQYGIHTLADPELLALILQSGTKEKSAIDIALELIYQFKGLENVFCQSLKQLCKIKGISKVKALHLCAIEELFVRIVQKQHTNKKNKFALNTALDVYYYLYYQVHHLLQEKIYVFYLNLRNVVLYEEIISYGNEQHSLLSNKNICKMAIEKNAKKVLMAHNHPSGDASPSLDDISAYYSLKNALTYIQVKLLDHIIIGENEYYSLQQEKMICLPF